MGPLNTLHTGGQWASAEVENLVERTCLRDSSLRRDTRLSTSYVKSRPPRPERLDQLRWHALMRFNRRLHESLRLEHYFRKKWCKRPPPGWTPYEKALRLEDEARLLIVRLCRAT
jgi:hypothetical protein